MKSEILNSIPTILYLNNRKVEVIKRISFRLAQVRYLEEKICFYIDENLLTENKMRLLFALICLKEYEDEFGFFA
jgi:hypothetical protein